MPPIIHTQIKATCPTRTLILSRDILNLSSMMPSMSWSPPSAGHSKPSIYLALYLPISLYLSICLDLVVDACNRCVRVYLSIDVDAYLRDPQTALSVVVDWR